MSLFAASQPQATAAAAATALTGDSGDEFERPEHADGPERAQVDAVVLLAAVVAGGPRRVLGRQDGDVPGSGAT